MSTEETTSLQVYKRDKEAFDNLKLSPGEFDRDQFRRILNEWLAFKTKEATSKR